jgi:hypothetical protein
LHTALGHAVEQAEALQTSYNSSEQELQELRDAALETYRSVEEGEAQAGSSLASRLRALSGHFTERMRRALHLGVQKALRVVRSHYKVNFEALAEGYVVPEGVEDEVAMERVDALAADAAGSLLTVKIRQPSHEFTFGVGMSFIPYPLVLTPVV